MKKTVSIYFSVEGEDHRSLIEHIASKGMPDDAVVIYSGRNTVAVIPSGGIMANIKAFALPNIVNRYVYGRFREGKARRSFANSQRLMKLGFRVPAPLAFIEERTPVRFYRSYFISEHVGDLTEMRYPERHPFVDSLLEALGREMARLHKAGVWMKDFSPGNVLFRRDEAGRFEFYYVDLNRIEFDVTSQSKLDYMWERLLFDPGQIELAARAYADASGRDSDKVISVALSRWGSYMRRKKR